MPPPTPSTAPARCAVGALSQGNRSQERSKTDPKSIFFTVFRSHFGPILGPIWEPLGSLFGVKIDPSSAKMPFQPVSALKI